MLNFQNILNLEQNKPTYKNFNLNGATQGNAFLGMMPSLFGCFLSFSGLDLGLKMVNFKDTWYAHIFR